MTQRSPLVGRQLEIERLTSALADDGQVLLVGEAGVGKTRLAAEVAARLETQGHQVVTAACLRLSSPLPLLPIVDLLKALTTRAGVLSEAVLDACHPYVRTELARLVPELDPAPSSLPGSGQGWQQQRLFSAIVDFSRGIAHDRELTVIIEDLHWSDPSTRDFLSYVLGHETAGMSVLLTARDADGTGDTTTDWVRDLDLAGIVTSLQLGPLTRQEVGELAQGSVVPPMSVAALDDLFRRAEGNPFFTEQLLAAERFGPGDRLPEGLGQVLRARASHLDHPARRVLDLLALAGRELDEAEVGQGTGDELTNVRDALRDLLTGQLIRSSRAGGFVVTHALLGEAMAEVMLPGERAELSRSLAEILIARADPASAGEVADHLERARQSDQELPVRVTAAEYAEATYAFAAAAHQWERATTLAESHSDTRNQVAGLALRTMIALDHAGKMLEGAEWGSRGLVAAQQHDQRHLEAALWTRLGMIHDVDDRQLGRSEYRKAVELFEELPPSPEQVLALHLLYRSYELAGRFQAGVCYLERAIEIGEQGGFDKELVPPLISLSWQQSNAGDLDHGLATFQRARDLADALNDPFTTAFLALAETDGRVRLNLLVEAAAVGERELARLHAMGFRDAWITGGVVHNTVDALLALGRVDEAVVVLDETTVDSHNARIRWPEELAWSRVELARADFDACAARIEQIRGSSDLPGAEMASVLSRHRAELALWWGRRQKGLEIVQDALGLLKGTDEQRAAGPLLVLGMRACADLREGRGRSGSPPEHDIEIMLTEFEQLRIDPFSPHAFYVADAAEGTDWRAELARAQGSDDPQLWQTSIEAWDQLGRPHRAAYSRWRAAEAWLRAGDRQAAGACLRMAAAQAEQHVPLSWQITGLARMARIDLRQPVAAVAAEDPATPYGLTERELDVLRLLGDGLTNSQIGARLFMSPKTASVHVTAILRKLDATNRVHAAAIAQRAGLSGR